MSSIEKEIQEKGLTAPIVKPSDIDNEISGVFFFTARDAAKVTEPDDYQYFTHEKTLSLLKFCVIVTKCGFTVTGESACASPENYNKEIGEKVAFENAKEKLWPLMGYHLKQSLYGQGKSKDE